MKQFSVISMFNLLSVVEISGAESEKKYDKDIGNEIRIKCKNQILNYFQQYLCFSCI